MSASTWARRSGAASADPPPSQRGEIVAVYSQIADDLEAAGTQAMANLPLVASGRTIGALMATWSAPRDFDEDELRFLQTLAGQAALAIERAQLLLLLYTDGLIEQRNRGLTQGLEVLLELAAVVAGDDLERACDEIPRRVLGDEPREDDMCLLAVRATPQGAAHRLTFAQWLSAGAWTSTLCSQPDAARPQPRSGTLR